MMVHYVLLVCVPLAVRYPRLGRLVAMPALWLMALEYYAGEAPIPITASIVGLVVVGALVCSIVPRRALG